MSIHFCISLFNFSGILSHSLAPESGGGLPLRGSLHSSQNRPQQPENVHPIHQQHPDRKPPTKPNKAATERPRTATNRTTPAEPTATADTRHKAHQPRSDGQQNHSHQPPHLWKLDTKKTPGHIAGGMM